MCVDTDTDKVCVYDNIILNAPPPIVNNVTVTIYSGYDFEYTLYFVLVTIFVSIVLFLQYFIETHGILNGNNPYRMLSQQGGSKVVDELRLH